MNEKEYLDFLAQAPKDHHSKEFIDWLIDKNEVVKIWAGWLIIKNKKYWNPENDWLTAFFIGDFHYEDFQAIGELKWLLSDFGDREWLVKAPHKRTVKLFHVHLYKKI